MVASMPVGLGLARDGHCSASCPPGRRIVLGFMKDLGTELEWASAHLTLGVDKMRLLQR